MDMQLRRVQIVVPIFSAAVLFLLFSPLYFLDPSFHSVAPLGFSLAYIAAFRPRLLALWPPAFIVPILYHLGVLDAVWVLWYTVFTTVLAYLLALSLGDRGCRLVSLAIFWLMSQVAPFVVSLPLFLLLGPVFGAPLPNLWEYPLYVAVYWIIYQTHGRAVNRCQRYIEEPELRCWCSRE